MAKDNAKELLKYTHVSMKWKEAPLSQAPYLEGFGFWNTYEVTFTLADGVIIKVIALIENTIERVSEATIIKQLSYEIWNVKTGMTFDDWRKMVKKKYPKTSGDYCAVVRGTSDSEYPLKRFQYIYDLQEKMHQVFPGNYDLFEEFLFRSIIYDFPWSEEGEE